MPKLFVSYRREDTRDIAGRIVDHLRVHYGRSSVYIDIDAVPPGVDFRQHVSDAISACDVLVVLVGRRWLAEDGEGGRRIDRPDDFVRVEIESALKRSIPVVPVLIGGMPMPREQELPASLADFAYRNATQVDSGVDFHHHIDRLVRSLNAIPHAPRRPPPAATPEPAGEQDEDRAAPAREPAPAPAAFVVPRLSVPQGLFLTAALLVVNLFLAVFGSVLWARLPYWPAFMIYALVVAYFRGWGVVIAILAPVVSTALLNGGSPTAYLYAPVNLLQAALVFLAFRRFRIDPRLPGLRDKLAYLGAAVVAPSFVGGCAAWLLFRAAGAGPDAPLFQYAGWWTAENLVPAVLPGLWLHGVVGDIYRPFTWDARGRSRSWRRGRWSTPGLGSSPSGSPPAPSSSCCRGRCSGSPPLPTAGGPGGTSTRSPPRAPVPDHGAGDVHLDGLLARVRRAVGPAGLAAGRGGPPPRVHPGGGRADPGRQDPAFGATARDDRVGGHPPIRRTRVPVPPGRPGRLAQHLFRPDVLLLHLQPRQRRQADRRGAAVAVRPAAGAVRRRRRPRRRRAAVRAGHGPPARRAQRRVRAKGFPAIALGLGVHTGLVTAGHIGSDDRRSYTVVGEPVLAAVRLERQTRDLPAEWPPVLVSHATVKEGGLLLDPRFGDAFGPVDVESPGPEPADATYAVLDVELARAVLARAGDAGRPAAAPPGRPPPTRERP